MKYNITISERWDSATLYSELLAGGLTNIVINGHGTKSFDVTTSDDAAANVIITAHIGKGDAQHDVDINELENTNYIKAGLEGTAKNITKAIAIALFDEVNVLRTNAGLPVRTLSQFKNTVKGKL